MLHENTHFFMEASCFWDVHDLSRTYQIKCGAFQSQNEGVYYGTLLVFIMSISTYLFLPYETDFELLWLV